MKVLLKSKVIRYLDPKCTGSLFEKFQLEEKIDDSMIDRLIEKFK